MTILSEYIIKAETSNQYRLKFEIIANNVPSALDLAHKLLSTSGFPNFYLTDKHKKQHLLNSTELAMRLLNPNAFSYIHKMKAIHDEFSIYLECSFWENNHVYFYDRIILDLSLEGLQWRALSQKIHQLIINAANESQITCLEYQINRDKGHPFEAISRTLKLHWLYPPRLVLLDEQFFLARGGIQCWEKHGFIIKPVNNRRFLVEHKNSQTADNNQHNIGVSNDLIEIHCPSYQSKTSVSKNDILYKQTLD